MPTTPVRPQVLPLFADPPCNFEEDKVQVLMPHCFHLRQWHAFGGRCWSSDGGWGMWPCFLVEPLRRPFWAAGMAGLGCSLQMFLGVFPAMLSS